MNRPMHLSVGATLVVAALLGVLLDQPPSVEDPPASRLRVATYDVNGFYGAAGDTSFEALRDELEAIDADVVGLQGVDGARPETSNVDGVRWLARQLGYHAYQAPPAARGFDALGILSRFPLRGPTYFLLPGEDQPGRIALVVLLDTPRGTLPAFVAGFSESSSSVRKAQADSLASKAASYERVIVLGGFQTPSDPSDAAYASLDAAFNDAWTTPEPRSGGATFPADGPVQRLDHVWLRGPFGVLAAETFGSKSVSDHLGVVVDFDWGSETF